MRTRYVCIWKIFLEFVRLRGIFPVEYMRGTTTKNVGLVGVAGEERACRYGKYQAV